MGYRYGASQEQAERRKARLAARYGNPATAVDEPVAHGAEPVASEAPEAIAAPAPKKKGGRPKGSKNKGT